MSEKIKGTIQVKCDLRRLIRLSTEAGHIHAISTAVAMGLLPLLDRLAARASAIEDQEAKEILRILCLDGGAPNE